MTSKKKTTQKTSPGKKSTTTTSTKTDDNRLNTHLDKATRLSRALRAMAEELDAITADVPYTTFDDQNLNDLRAASGEYDLIIRGHVELLTKSGEIAASVQPLATMPGAIRPSALAEVFDRFYRMSLEQLTLPLRRQFSDFINAQHNRNRLLGSRASDTMDTTPDQGEQVMDPEGPPHTMLGMTPDEEDV